MIHPTVGRSVWFWLWGRSNGWEPHDEYGNPHSEQPYAALITRVWSDYCVDLVVFNPVTQLVQFETSVTLVQDPKQPVGTRSCEWMPYQKGQAVKQETVVELADICANLAQRVEMLENASRPLLR